MTLVDCGDAGGRAGRRAAGAGGRGPGPGMGAPGARSWRAVVAVRA